MADAYFDEKSLLVSIKLGGVGKGKEHGDRGNNSGNSFKFGICSCLYIFSSAPEETEVVADRSSCIFNPAQLLHHGGRIPGRQLFHRSGDRSIGLYPSGSSAL